MWLLSLGASAQQVTTGIVTDRAGNPISGARVEATGTSFYTMTSIDGRFSLETNVPIQKVKVTSAGKTSKVQYVSANTVVELSDLNWWNSKPTRYRWFVSPQITFLGSDSKDTPLGLAAGIVKQFGVYAKFMYSGMPSTKYSKNMDYGDVAASTTNSSNSNYYSNYYLYGSDYKTGFMSVTGGAIVRLGPPVYLMLGLGYVKRKVAVEHISGEYIDFRGKQKNFIAEAMMMAEYKHFTLNAGASFWSEKMKNSTLNIGVGYMF